MKELILVRRVVALLLVFSAIALNFTACTKKPVVTVTKEFILHTNVSEEPKTSNRENSSSTTLKQQTSFNQQETAKQQTSSSKTSGASLSSSSAATTSTSAEPENSSSSYQAYLDAITKLQNTAITNPISIQTTWYTLKSGSGMISTSSNIEMDCILGKKSDRKYSVVAKTSRPLVEIYVEGSNCYVNSNGQTERKSLAEVFDGADPYALTNFAGLSVSSKNVSTLISGNYELEFTIEFQTITDTMLNKFLSVVVYRFGGLNAGVGKEQIASSLTVNGIVDAQGNLLEERIFAQFFDNGIQTNIDFRTYYEIKSADFAVTPPESVDMENVIQ